MAPKPKPPPTKAPQKKAAPLKKAKPRPKAPADGPPARKTSRKRAATEVSFRSSPAKSPPARDCIAKKLGAVWAFVSNVGKSMQQAMLRLQSLPSNFAHMVLGVLTVQRFYLELEGLLDYMLVYKPRMEDFDPAAPANDVAKCLGAFISQPEVAQCFHSAGLPFWLYRPLAFFGPENILAVVTPLEPPPIIDQPALPEQPVVYSGNSTEGKILVMAAVAVFWPCATWLAHTSTPATGDILTTLSPLPLVISSCLSPSLSPSRFAPGPSKPLAGPKSVQKFHPYSRPPTTSQKASSSKQSQPAHPSRDKFEKFDAAEMPTYILLWSKALRAVETAGIKSRSTSAANKHYVLPEPALLASPERPAQRQLFIHHWVLLKDVLHYRIGAQETPLCLLSQEWRDKRAHANARTIDSIIGPALQQFSIDPSAGFHPPCDTYPTHTVEQARAIIWDISEMNFRFELMALDKRASLYTREEEVTRCFPVLYAKPRG
ncbi:hypothetical protein C8F04DRAFT_1269390 [Mycena alexandri]|uniref:Uncharacterized protein n=1 Tax=Mycena alexandri TaxID=1745969 RepID=A0AAD6SCE4_9AGAR|nr:hypothetical protein C8F04DRAFT_1269390 [Mycena alexandri]